MPVGPLRCLAMITSAMLSGMKVGLAHAVVVFAVQEHDHVGVLLDRARFAQVAHARAVPVAAFAGAVELREADDRHVQLARDRLDAAARFR